MDISKRDGVKAMKKILSVFMCLIVCLLFVSACEAEGRWQNVQVSGDVDVFFDMQTIRFEDGTATKIRFWQKSVLHAALANSLHDVLSSEENSGQAAYFLENRVIDLTNRTSAVYELSVYDQQNVLLETQQASVPVWESIRPGSAGERIYQEIAAYAAANRQRLLLAKKVNGQGSDLND